MSPADWLRDQLTAGRTESARIKLLAAQAGIGTKALRNARERLGVVATRSGNGQRMRSTWALAPERVPEAKQPEPAPNPQALSYSDRNNPNRLTGRALQDLAFKRGIPRTDAEGMSDAKLREQLRYIDAREYEDS